MLIVSLAPSEAPLDTILDIRVDDSPEPITELERLCQLAEAYREHELGLRVLAADAAQALDHWTRAAELAPGNEELVFWRAVAMASAGQRADARQLLRSLFRANSGWCTLLARLPAAGLLPDDAGLLVELIGEGA